MGMFSKGAIASLNKQAEEALKPKKEVISITANEARKIMQEALTSEPILEAAHSLAEECLSTVKERAQNGYHYTTASVAKYDHNNPKHRVIIERAKKILEEKGYIAYRDVLDNTLTVEW